MHACFLINILFLNMQIGTSTPQAWKNSIRQEPEFLLGNNKPFTIYCPQLYTICGSDKLNKWLIANCLFCRHIQTYIHTYIHIETDIRATA